MSSRNIYDPYSCLVGLSSLSSSSGDVFKLDVCLSCRRLISHSCSLYSLFFFFFIPPPPHAVSVSLGLLIETCPQSVWRHSMPSGWFICSVTHRSSCCETPLHSASIWGILEWMWCISSDIDSVKQFSSFSLLAAELSLAEMTLCSSLTAPLCVCLVLCNGLIGCHGHWLTRQASSELVIPSIFLPTARVINI